MAHKPRWRLDLRGIVGMRPSDKRRRMQVIAKVVLAEWAALARHSDLKSTKRAYIRSLRIGEVTETKAEVILEPGNAPIVAMVEQGMGPGGIGTFGMYDLRAFLLKPGTSRLRRAKAGHYYLHVPFRMESKEIGALGGHRAVKAARALGPTTMQPGQTGPRTAWGQKLGAGFAPNLRPQGYIHKRSGFHVRAHATDPLHGVYRFLSTYSNSAGKVVQQAQYRKFRTISDAAKPWYHPGVRPRFFAAIVTSRFSDIVREVT